MRGKSANKGTVRIIGGRWRGRKLHVPDLPGLRPCSDRSRETLFNWLQPWIAGAACADLFAGSGALGLEAASRGAASVELVEISPLAIASLVDSIKSLDAGNVKLHRGDALQWLAQVQPDSLDIVFVDPPFESGLLAGVLKRIAESSCVRPGGFVYVESPARLPAARLDEPFDLHREKVMGAVRMQLFKSRDA